MTTKEDYGSISQKVDKTYVDCMSSLREIRKREANIVNDFNKKTDLKKIDIARKEIDVL